MPTPCADPGVSGHVGKGSTLEDLFPFSTRQSLLLSSQSIHSQPIIASSRSVRNTNDRLFCSQAHNATITMSCIERLKPLIASQVILAQFLIL